MATPIFAELNILFPDPSEYKKIVIPEIRFRLLQFVMVTYKWKLQRIKDFQLLLNTYPKS